MQNEYSLFHQSGNTMKSVQKRRQKREVISIMKMFYFISAKLGGSMIHHSDWWPSSDGYDHLQGCAERGDLPWVNRQPLNRIWKRPVVIRRPLKNVFAIWKPTGQSVCSSACPGIAKIWSVRCMKKRNASTALTIWSMSLSEKTESSAFLLFGTDQSNFEEISIKNDIKPE